MADFVLDPQKYEGHTPGLWRWEFNQEYKKLALCGGAKPFDLTVMDFDRWGMAGATMRLRDLSHDGMNLLYKVHERQDWLTPQPGREHHSHWFKLVNHADANLIADAPAILAEAIALRARVKQMEAEKAELVNTLAEVVGVLRSEAPGTPMNNQKYDGLGIKCIEMINKHKEPSHED